MAFVREGECVDGSSRGSRTLILVRVREVTRQAEDLRSQLAEATESDVVFLEDRTRTEDENGDVATICITLGKIRKLGLYCPPDVTWRCGDYGLYIARLERPDYDHYWLIEDDVRISGRAETLFERCQTIETEMLAVQLRPANCGWYWWPHAQSRDAVPFRCLFPIARLRGDAIDRLLTRRRQHSRDWSRRLLWPNDEAFVATSMVHDGAATLDFNEIGLGEIYSESSFNLSGVREDYAERLMLLHPVRWAGRPVIPLKSERGLSHQAFRLKRWLVRRINRNSRW